MSKELLEEIEEAYRLSHKHIGAYVSSEGIEWLIGQAKRVQELEGREQKLIEINQHELKYRAEVETQNIELEQQNKRYREVINNINEKASLFGVNEQVNEAIKEAIRALEGEE